jgi:4-hydroxybenzoate polyprenyltransferase
LFNVKPNYIVASGLSIGLWVIYTLDHLLDGLSIGVNASSVRHREHFLKHKLITRLILSGLLSLIGLSFWLPETYYSYILFLCMLTSLHFWINYTLSVRFIALRYFKEVFVAFVVTIGFVITPTFEAQSDINVNQVICVFLFFYLINLSNLFLFSYFDKERDQKDNMITIAQFYGLEKLRGLIYIGIGVSFIVLVISFMYGYIVGVSFLIFLAMQTTLIGIIIFPSFFRTNDRYRFFGDLIYLYPLITFSFLG